MKIAYIAQLCELTALLFQKNKDFLAALKESQPKADIARLRKEMTELCQDLRAVRTGITETKSLAGNPTSRN